jgi:hypothetical protein
VERQTAATAQQPIRLRNLSWLTYGAARRVLEFGEKYIPQIRPAGIVNWKKRIEALRPWLRDLCANVENRKLRGAFEAQLKPGADEATLFLIAGVALGTLELPYAVLR